MKQFQVYGIGNALVDIDFEVSANTLERLKVAKGVMTLIDEETHHHLLKELHDIQHLKACGGSAANTLFTMQQMGAKTFYSCKVGNDPAGDFYYQDLISHGIETNVNAVTRDGVTGKCIVLVTPDADRTMNTFLGTTAQFSISQLSEDALKASQYLYIEGYLVASELGREAAIVARQLAKKHDVKVAMSLSDPNMVTYFKSGLIEMIGDRIDILFCNEQEALLFTDSQDLLLAQEKLKQLANIFVITCGAKGAIVYDGERSLSVPAYKVNVVDTVGAGDVFAGVFLYCVTGGYGFEAATDLANYAASKVVMKFGPRLNAQEVSEIRKFSPLEKVYA